MSKREAQDFSIEAQVRDLDAVVTSVADGPIALAAARVRSVSILAYAAEHPECVSHLILYAGALNVLDRSPALTQALDSFIDVNWNFYTEIRARILLGWDSADASAHAELYRRSHTPESFRVALSTSLPALATFASRITLPTLIIHRDSVASEGPSRETASAIPGAQTMGIPGDWFDMYPNSIGLDAILDFINTAPESSIETVLGRSLDTGAFRTILFTDLEAHTAMLQRLGDTKGREVPREHERACREALRAYGGTEVKTIGDSFMASFHSAQKAVECAIALQRAFASGDFPGERLRIRVGINAGEPIADEDDLFGSSVILASRTKEKAAAGEIFVTDVVRQLVAGKGFAFTDRGEMEMKGFEEPVRLYEVRWQ